MARFRSQKSQVLEWLKTPQWREHLEAIADEGVTSVGPLMAFLMYEPLLRMRAAIALGVTVAKLFSTKQESARDVVRRLNWRMSEESGNIGWGVPEAMGEVLAACPALGKEYYKIFFSTILDLGFDDNYVDNDVLRRSCYFAIGRFIRACPKYGAEVRPLLVRGLDDEDAVCQGMAAWALAAFPVDINEAPALRRVIERDHNVMCVITDGDKIEMFSPAELALQTMKGKVATKLA